MQMRKGVAEMDDMLTGSAGDFQHGAAFWQDIIQNRDDGVSVSHRRRGEAFGIARRFKDERG
jgi:hypothetical protein